MENIGVGVMLRYATVSLAMRNDVTGTESHVALAILGDAEIGDKVLFENFSYELIRQ